MAGLKGGRDGRKLKGGRGRRRRWGGLRRGNHLKLVPPVLQPVCQHVQLTDKLILQSANFISLSVLSVYNVISVCLSVHPVRRYVRLYFRSLYLIYPISSVHNFLASFLSSLSVCLCVCLSLGRSL